MWKVDAFIMNCDFSRDRNYTTFKKFHFNEEKTWFTEGSKTFDESNSIAFSEETIVAVAKRASSCRQKYSFKCSDSFQMFGSSSSTKFGALHSTYLTKLPGATQSLSCPCRNSLSCGGSNTYFCNCNGVSESATDEGFISYDASMFSSYGSNIFLPIASISINEPTSSGKFEWNLKGVECPEYKRAGILFSFNNLFTSNFPIDKNFGAKYTVNKISAITSGNRKAVKLIQNHKIELYTVQYSATRCFSNILDCELGLSVSFWYRPSIDSTNAVLLSSNTTEAGFNVIFDNGKLIVEVIANQKVWRTTSAKFRIANWIHTAFTWHDFKGLKLYINSIKSLMGSN